MSSRSRRTFYVALAIAVGLFVTLLVAGVVFYPTSTASIDCGPNGKPALNGTACIDREPVAIP
jgi:hypothetical protein